MTTTPDSWDTTTGSLTDRALHLAASCDDATKAARRLAEAADRAWSNQWGSDRFTALASVRWRLTGVLDADPSDLVALAALGLAALAALEPEGG